MDDPGTVAIIGSGGIGGYIAGALERGGRQATLCVRTPFERLVIVERGREREVRVPIATDPGAVGPARWVLVTTKAQEVAGAKPWLDALARPGTTVAMIQNGVDHVSRVAAHLPDGVAILPTIIHCSVERTAPGRIVHHHAARMSVPAGAEGAAFAELFAGTGFEVVEEADFLTTAWRKLLSNAVANPITALTLRRMTVFQAPAMLALAQALMAEVVTVARAEGAEVTAADGERVLAGYRNMASGGSSMFYDRLADRPLEHDFITGAVVAAGDRHGVPVPLNRAILALVQAVSGQPRDGSA